MEVSTQRHIPVADIHLTGDWVGPRAGLVEAECRELKTTIGGNVGQPYEYVASVENSYKILCLWRIIVN
jgi:hypothetical protein